MRRWVLLLVALGVTIAVGEAAVAGRSSAMSLDQSSQPRLVLFESFLHGG